MTIFNYKQKYFYLFLSIVSIMTSCTSEGEKRFTLLQPSHTGVTFVNQVEDTPDFNILNYLYFYDGGGVAVGDINNNGLSDLFFVGNEVANKLYLNKGQFQFEDITESAGVAGDPGTWSTGATMADVNGDGYLDIYVSRVNYHNKEGTNQLFINNGDGTFTDRAPEYGLDFVGYSTQAVFFDYNNNGRLDMFLLNHSFHSEKNYGEADKLRGIPDSKAGDKLFRNEGDRFTDVTEKAGIYSSALGFGLGVAVSDINKNGWLDIYVGNDFHEDDYLYINNGDGTFTESLYSSFKHTSVSSMGNDIADINNNGYVDLVSLDMMPEDHTTYMRSEGPDLQRLHQAKIDHGFGFKNARNTLQLNRGLSPDGTPLFSEIAFTAGIARTDWSWASLFMDLNNSGWKDLFITNGIVRRPNDLDYLRNFSGRIDLVDKEEKLELIELLPSEKIANYAFQNNGNLTFTNKAEEWGLSHPGFSSGAAYVDLNNNGRLDLVVNNVNMQSFIYKNNTPNDNVSNYLKIKLNGSEKNTSGIGSKVILYYNEKIFYQEQMPTRGFQSSVDHTLHFGLGDIVRVDSLVVIWPDRSYQTEYDVEVNQLIQISKKEALNRFDYNRLHRSWNDTHYRNITDEVNINFKHQENDFNDFSREPLMPYKLSTQGPALAVGDLTENGLDDFYIGGATGQSGKLFLQQINGEFISLASNEKIFGKDRASEDVDATFFDANGNGLLDLYVVSGGGELTGKNPALMDRIYINEGKGKFKKSIGALPQNYVNGSIVRAADFNNNGHIDLFVGGRSIPYRYGESPRSFLLANDGNGNFQDITEQYAPELKEIGMVTDAQWAHISNEQYPDLVVVGEWMPVQLFQNNSSSLVLKSEEIGLLSSSGLWQSIEITDINDNGLPDIIAGNFGNNSMLQATADKPLRLYVNDFIDNGQLAPIITNYINGNYYPFEKLDEILVQFRSSRNRSYKKYATQSIHDIFDRSKVESSLIKEIQELKSSIFLNNGDGKFTKITLPIETQFSPVMAIHIFESENNEEKHILMGGNLYDVKPSAGGRQDASYGLLIKMDLNNKSSFEIPELQSSGFLLDGEVRGIKQIKTSNGYLIIVARNNDQVQLFRSED